MNTFFYKCLWHYGWAASFIFYAKSRELIVDWIFSAELEAGFWALSVNKGACGLTRWVRQVSNKVRGKGV